MFRLNTQTDMQGFCLNKCGSSDCNLSIWLDQCYRHYLIHWDCIIAQRLAEWWYLVLSEIVAKITVELFGVILLIYILVPQKLIKHKGKENTDRHEMDVDRWMDGLMDE